MVAGGRRETRHRLLPARVVVYDVLALGLFPQASYEEVMRNLVEGLSWMSGWSHTSTMPTKAALFQARKRLGPDPVQALFEAFAKPLAASQTGGAFTAAPGKPSVVKRKMSNYCVKRPERRAWPQPTKRSPVVNVGALR